MSYQFENSFKNSKRYQKYHTSLPRAGQVLQSARKTESSVRVVARFRPLLGEEAKFPDAFRISADGTKVESVDRGAGVLFGLERVFDSVPQEQLYNEASLAGC